MLLSPGLIASWERRIVFLRSSLNENAVISLQPAFAILLSSIKIQVWKQDVRWRNQKPLLLMESMDLQWGSLRKANCSVTRFLGTLVWLEKKTLWKGLSLLSMTRIHLLSWYAKESFFKESRHDGQLLGVLILLSRKWLKNFWTK